MDFLNALPGAVAQGLIWGLMAIGLYISYKILNIADLTVDGSICTGACVCAILLKNGNKVLVSFILAAFIGILVASCIFALIRTILHKRGVDSVVGILLSLLISPSAGIIAGACFYVVLLKISVNHIGFIFICLIISFLAGALAGMFTGLCHTLMGIPPILAGILTQLILWSVNLKILGKPTVSISSRGNTVLLTSLNIPMAILVAVLFCVFVIVALFLFFYTEIGLSVKSTGDNADMSEAQGVNVKFNKVLGLAISNGIVALSGALLAQYQGFADINMGRGAIVIGLAAIIIGLSVSLKIKPNFVVSLIGVVGGGIAYFLVYTFVIWLGIDTDLLKMLSALVVTIFLAIPYLKKEYFTKPKIPAEILHAQKPNGGDGNA